MDVMEALVDAESASVAAARMRARLPRASERVGFGGSEFTGVGGPFSADCETEGLPVRS